MGMWLWFHLQVHENLPSLLGLDLAQRGQGVVARAHHDAVLAAHCRAIADEHDAGNFALSLCCWRERASWCLKREV